MSSPHPTTAPSRAKLLRQQDLQDLRARLFKLKLSAIHKMVEDGADATSIAGLADLHQALEAVERLQLPARERS